MGEVRDQRYSAGSCFSMGWNEYRIWKHTVRREASIGCGSFPAVFQRYHLQPNQPVSLFCFPAGKSGWGISCWRATAFCLLQKRNSGGHRGGGHWARMRADRPSCDGIEIGRPIPGAGTFSWNLESTSSGGDEIRDRKTILATLSAIQHDSRQ